MAHISITVVLTVFALCGANNVPVLMWSPSRSLSDLPSTHAGSTVDGTSFQNNYLTPLTSKGGNLVAFVQDKLSLEDFSKHADVYNLDSEGGVFKNVKGLMEEHFSLDLPAVKDAHAALEDLRGKFDGAVHTVSSPKELGKLNLGKKFLLIVKLPPTAGQAEEEALTRCDGMIKEVVHHLQKRDVAYTALYTAQSAAHKSEAAHLGRHLLAESLGADNVTTPLFINMSGTGYLYLEGLDVELYKLDKGLRVDQQMVSVANVSATTRREESASNVTVSVLLEYGDVKTNASAGASTYNVTVKFVASNFGMDWQMENLTISVLNGSTSLMSDMMLMLYDMRVPNLFSYHCGSLTVRTPITVNSTWRVDLIFKGFQFQPFHIDKTNGTFADSWDCIGFFTNGIWMGLVPVLLLLILTIWGVYMMLGLSTMDRFDDPKGKSITVNVVE